MENLEDGYKILVSVEIIKLKAVDHLEVSVLSFSFGLYVSKATNPATNPIPRHTIQMNIFAASVILVSNMISSFSLI